MSFKKDVTFFVGENGTGKSTLIEAIAVAAGFNAEGGTANYQFTTRATHSELWEALSISKLGNRKMDFSYGQKVFTTLPTILMKWASQAVTEAFLCMTNPMEKVFWH